MLFDGHRASLARPIAYCWKRLEAHHLAVVPFDPLKSAADCHAPLTTGQGLQQPSLDVPCIRAFGDLHVHVAEVSQGAINVPVSKGPT